MKSVKCLLLLLIMLTISMAAYGHKRLLFDRAHGQCKGNNYTADVLPDYRAMCDEMGVEFVINDEKFSDSLFEDYDVVFMMSPLQKDLQVDLTDEEIDAIVNFVNRGGSFVVFIDEESHRVEIERFGINRALNIFGVELSRNDVQDVKGNCGGISIENQIFAGRYEIPYSGGRQVKGGIPAAVCMDGGWVHSTYVVTPTGGKLFASGETMVALLMGSDEVERHGRASMTQRGWWGKDSYQFIREVIAWAVK